MKRFFGRDDDEDRPVAERPNSDEVPMDPGPPSAADEHPGSAEPPAVAGAVRSAASAERAPDPWDLQLIPAFRQTAREPATPEASPTDAPTQGPAAIAARLDMLQSTMRAFRDTVGTRLSDYSGALGRLGEADQAAARKLTRLQEDFAGLSAGVEAAIGRLDELVAQVKRADLEAFVADLAAHRQWSEQQTTELVRSSGASSDEARRMVAALSTRLDGVDLSIAGLAQELQMLRRRIPVTRRGPEPPGQSEVGSDRPRRRR